MIIILQRNFQIWRKQIRMECLATRRLGNINQPGVPQRIWKFPTINLVVVMAKDRNALPFSSQLLRFLFQPRVLLGLTAPVRYKSLDLTLSLSLFLVFFYKNLLATSEKSTVHTLLYSLLTFEVALHALEFHTLYHV